MNSAWNRLIKKRKKIEQTLYDETEINSNKQEISKQLDENLKNIKEALGNSGDLAIREFKMGKPSLHKVALIYINGLADKEIIGSFIIERLMGNVNNTESVDPQSPSQLFTYMKENILTVGTVKDITDWNKMLLSLLSGQTILLIDDWNQAISCSAEGGDLRAITEPTTESAVRGPKESFVESLITNTAMVRRRIKSPNLWVETMKIGNFTQTDVAIMYVKGIVNDKLLTEVKERLSKIEVDEVASSNTIEEWINDDTWTPWPTMLVTERPDVVAGNLMEGRVAIFVDGTPFPLLLPATMSQFFQTAEDYYMRWNIASFLRLLRVVTFLITLLGPSLFIAFISFHQELIPTPLLVSLTAQRQAIPFPVFIEALLMEFTFEVLREAGVRMPRTVGQAVSIVGALVLGEAAVLAGIVSSSMVIVVAGTAIASFTIPHASMMDAARLLRFLMMVLAASFGLYGVGLGVIVLVAHTCSVRSFGIPYLAPFAPLIFADWKDTLIRIPKPFLSTRPRLINQTKIKRTGNTENLGPSPRENQIKDNESKRDSNET
ncbi:spore germination protein [Peribacillus sp. V2I11]|uniref:spore germination protein n=1 Tax=Peribacillus sp. V2I11 TaxID=3042277 RepID=UPI00277EC551|nr:spore germination protein [Peribacillus sp. V2I11]MDQ0879409.1 spore germination protein KA [Peribacillus sp. V2I11]